VVRAVTVRAVANENSEPVIRQAVEADAGAVACIYNHYVRETIVTFEEPAGCFG
jgi:hypothetical protein